MRIGPLLAGMGTSTEIDVPPFPDTGLALIMEGRAGVPYKDHAAGAVGDAIIRLCGDLVE